MSTSKQATAAPTVGRSPQVIAEFVRHIDAAAAAAERQRASEVARGATADRLAQLDLLLGKLRGVRTAALTGTLPPSHGRVRLGFSRFVPEWNEVPEIVDLMYPIDDFYQYHM